MARISLDDSKYFLNRDTSWLAFNRRVLEEAEDEGNPLLERLKFLSISASNLHEFVEHQYDCWNARLRPALSQQGIRVLGLHELDADAMQFVDEYCERELDPLLTPVTVDPAHPFPRVINKALCVAFLLRRRRRSALTY